MIVKTECSSCSIEVRVNLDAGTITATIPSNGKRGKGHRPAHKVTGPLADADDLVLWDCPGCGYADSTYTDADTRADLS